MRDEILAKHPTARLRVFVVWFDMLTGDSRALIDLRVLGDPRATNFWDGQKAVGRWFAANVPESRGLEVQPITWDAYLLYGADARWGSGAPGPLISLGRTVSGTHDRLRSSIVPLLRP